MWKMVALVIGLAALLDFSEACEPPTLKYRTFSGSCNNLKNNLWGSTNSLYARAVPPEYGDGVSTPRRAKNGEELPNARFLSTSLYGNANVLDPDLTLLEMQFGQFISHDLALTAGVSDPLPCCDAGQLSSTPADRCFAITIPPNDLQFGSSGTHCVNVIRTLTNRDLNPGSTSNLLAEQINLVTSYLDLSIVYGLSQDNTTDLRAFTGGQMKVLQRTGVSWPPEHPVRAAGCPFATSETHCYLTGDSRSNQSPHLAILQIAFLREHNRIAAKLQWQHPSWTDWQLFQEARRINIAQYQYIVYYEYLPTILGRNAMIADKLIFPKATGYVADYDSAVDPSIINSHSTAAMRFFHTEIVGLLQLLDSSRNLINTVKLSDNINDPAILEQSAGYDSLVRGFSMQAAAAIDDQFDPEIQDSFFLHNTQLGADLRAVDIQRARDHGIAGYNAMREYCGLPRATKWADFGDLIDPANIVKLQSVYKAVDDVEYTVAAAFERKYLDSKVGRTYHCILMKQFKRTRQGDRFFFENDQQTNRFTLLQLYTIRQASIASILCNTTPNIPMMQAKAFQQVSQNNPLQKCSTLPTVSLTLW